MKSLMKQRINPAFWILTLLFVCLGIFAVWWISPNFTVTPRERLQMELAKELGVNIQDYPYPLSFPSGYYSVILKPGMSVEEVHEVVRGYEQVVHCENIAEIYYYFSTELKDAKRFQIIYDDGVYSRFQGEEDDSRTLNTDGCLPGLIEE